jgi:carbon-monoxide dehydrogenase iron sulfur subunit
VLKVLVADYEKCTGCRNCEMACSLHHFGECNPVKSAVQIVKWEAEGLDVPMICQQCQEAACEAICPVKAISRDVTTGALGIDTDLCIGCRMCMIACPFGAVAYIADQKRAFKCDLCDGEPLCVRYCEPQALTFEIPAQTSLTRRRKVGLEMVDARTKTLQALQSVGARV